MLKCPICKDDEAKKTYKDFHKCKCGILFKKKLENIQYEGNYWGTAVDPDGKIRSKINERDLTLDDYKKEIKYINNLKPGNILDLGMGIGFFLSAIDKEWEKYGTEISKKTIKFVKENYPEIKINKKTPDQYFDVIAMIHLIEHLENPVEEINKIYKLLKPNGLLIITTPNIESFCARRFKENFRLLHDKTHITMFGTSTLKRLLKSFRIEKTYYPFFETRYFTLKNLLRLFNKNNISPPFYGNVVTVYARKVFGVLS